MLDATLAAISYQPVQRIGFGALSVSPHGLGTAGGFLLGALLMARAAERRGIPRPEVYNAVTWGAVGALIGSRGFYVLAHLSDFGSITDVLAVWRGGLTMFGGFAGGIAFGVAYLWRHSIDIARAMDAAAPGFVAGVAVGRVGDLIIADHLGDPTGFVLGYRIPQGADLAPGFGPPTYIAGAVVHQTALYDLLGTGLLTVFVALVASRRPRPGTLFCSFAVWYGLQRFVIDFTRNRELIESSFFGLSGSQWAGLLFSAVGLGLLGVIWTRRPAEAAAVEAIPEPVMVAAETVVVAPESVVVAPEAVAPSPEAVLAAAGVMPEPAVGTPAAAPEPEEVPPELVGVPEPGPLADEPLADEPLTVLEEIGSELYAEDLESRATETATEDAAAPYDVAPDELAVPPDDAGADRAAVPPDDAGAP